MTKLLLSLDILLPSIRFPYTVKTQPFRWRCFLLDIVPKEMVTYLRLAIPMFSEGSLCLSCNTHRMDQWGYHAVHYSSEVGVKFRHNLVCDILVDICSKVGIMVRKEAPMGFLSGDGKDL
ncbi:hypothetical protein Tco_0675984 [Tanacetum coccineum]